MTAKFIDELFVRNLGVIAEARVTFGMGLTVVTGETGAGKSLFLGAIRQLAENSVARAAIGPAGDDAAIEARFTSGEEFTVAKKLSHGATRSYLDGSAVPSKKVAATLEPLIEIVTQHQHLALTRPGHVRELVDRVLDEEGRAAKENYRLAWTSLAACRAALEEVAGDPQALEREADLVEHQAAEIRRAGIDLAADATLGDTVAVLRNAEEISDVAIEALEALEKASEGAGSSVTELRRLAGLDAELGSLREQSESIAVQVDELMSELRKAAEARQPDSERLTQTEERLSVLAGLRRKYGSALDEVVEFGVRAEERGIEVRAMLAAADDRTAELRLAEEAVESAATTLRRCRRKAGERLVAESEELLGELGFEEPTVSIEIHETEARPHGGDEVQLLFASDRRLTPGPVGRVASGGELSRLVLALRVAAGGASFPIVVFDEIDAGVGGETALALGRTLSTLARGRQVLCVTHLPQVAAFADHHFIVTREGAAASVTEADDKARTDELTRMLAGLVGSEGGRQHAEELQRLAATRAESGLLGNGSQPEYSDLP